MSFDFKARNTYTLVVRMIDREGVWTDSMLNLRIADVVENPVLYLPATVSANGGAAVLGAIRIGGDGRTRITVLINSARAAFDTSTKDPEVTVYKMRNGTGGMGLALIGTVDALNRNFRYVYYLCYEDSIWAVITGLGCRGSGPCTIRLVRTN